MVQTTIIPIAARGLATSFAEAEVPTDFCIAFTNRYINGSGDAEKREGITSLGPVVEGVSNVTGLHEIILDTGESVKFASGDGQVHRWTGSAWSLFHSFPTTTERIRSVQMGDKLIFFNGADPTMWTDNGTKMKELKAILEVGTVSDATATTFRDVDVSSWSIQTGVSENDIVFWPETGQTAIITTVSGSEVRHSNRTLANFGFAAVNAADVNGTSYEIYDSIELNIFETKSGLYKDNIAVATTGTNTTDIFVSGVTFDKTEIRVGDIIYNTTRGSGAYVKSVHSDKIVTDAVQAQAAGDSLTFLKPASPIFSNATVHYGRLYGVDARDKRKIRISGANNPLDWTIDSASIDLTDFGGVSKGNEYNAGSLSPEGETIQALTTFQSFLIIGGTRNIFAFSGSQPFGDDADFQPLAVLPFGVKSPDGLINLGNDVAWISDNGVQLYSYTEQNSIIQKTISEPLNKSVRAIVKNAEPEELILMQYPRRQWMLVKLGSELFIWNFAPITLARNQTRSQTVPSWFKFEGGFANQQSFKVMSDGDLWVGGAGGVVSRFDQGDYNDNGELYQTDYRTGWHWIDGDRSENTKTVKFFEPYMETSNNITYTVDVEGDWDATSEDTREIISNPPGSPIGSFVVGESTIGGSRIFHPKISMRARGKAFRFRIRTLDALGPDVISRFAVHWNRMGRR